MEKVFLLLKGKKNHIQKVELYFLLSVCGLKRKDSVFSSSEEKHSGRSNRSRLIGSILIVTLYCYFEKSVQNTFNSFSEKGFMMWLEKLLIQK